MDTRPTPESTSAKVFVLVFCVAEPLMGVVTGVWGLAFPISFANANFPTLLQNPSTAASPEMMGMARLAALMILVLAPLERIALWYGSRKLRVLFLSAMLFGDVLHFGAATLYESSVGGWSATGVAAIAIATALGVTRTFYLVSGRVPVNPRLDPVAPGR